MGGPGIPYSVLYDFDNLYQAHRRAKLGKGGSRDVVAFDMGLSAELWELANDLLHCRYRPSPYLHFTVFEPKVRSISAPSYRDRVLQHCLCDTIIAPTLENRLIHDNAACRVDKGTHFAIRRFSAFLTAHVRAHGTAGYLVKADIRHYFASIDHGILKTLLRRAFTDPDVVAILDAIIDSYHTDGQPGTGLPLGNQTSQWFGLLYLDGLDRLVKERLHIRGYSRYMDDMVLVVGSKAEAVATLDAMREHIEHERRLAFNAKTEVRPLAAGVTYLGWRFLVTDTGTVVRRLDSKKKAGLRRRMRAMRKRYQSGKLAASDYRTRVESMAAHLAHGHTYALRRAVIASSGGRNADSQEGPVGKRTTS